MLKGASAILATSSLAGFIPATRAASAAATSVAPKYRHAFAAIHRTLDTAVADHTVAGVVAMAANREGLIYQGAAGTANLDAKSMMSAETVFWMLSMTKAITATACMQLIEKGRLHLEQRADEIIPELASRQILQGFDAAGKPRLRAANKPITVRHLLTHTSGFTYSGWSSELTEYEKVTGMADIATSKNGAFAAPLEFEPGERWQYGISMDWVGKLIEAVTDQSLEIYFRENIFQPLGMVDSGFLINSEQKRRVATLHMRQPDGSLRPAPFEMPQRPEFFSGGGGLFSTPRDYLNFLQMLAQGGSLNGVQVLQPDTVKTMFQNHIGDLNVVEMKSAQPVYSENFNQFPDMVHKWGLSFDINTQPGPNGRSAGSGSWGGLLNCYFWVDPVQQLTGAIFTQTLPFYDDAVVKLYGEFERELYRGLNQA
jgi:CubicO group peptidase (beta-lactamase class C family)